MNKNNNNISVKQAANFLKQNDNFVIICHSNPDGDTLGCGYGLCGALQLAGKRAEVICDDVPSERFNFLLEAVIPELSASPELPETVITVDVADLQLLGSLNDKYPRIDLCIDHHVSNKDYAVRTLLDTEAAACAEIIWELIKEINGEQLKDVKNSKRAAAVAAAIYTGVSTDTGCFKYSNTTLKSHLIAAELMGYNFDAVKINYLMFELKTRARLKLEQTALDEIEYYLDGKVAVITLANAVLDGVDPEDTSNVSALPKQIEGVEAGVVMKEKKPGTWKVSVRTGERINAQAICGKFGGGGHLRAAGCTLEGNLTEIKSAIIKEIEKQLTEN